MGKIIRFVLFYYNQPYKYLEETLSIIFEKIKYFKLNCAVFISLS